MIRNTAMSCCSSNSSGSTGLSNRLDPFVSIVTVSLNAARTIEDTIASVSMQQAGFVIEHICVDGGSSDGTREIIDRWAARSERIRRVYEPDSGIFDAMNKGLRAARGEYVLFLNADDFLVAPDILARATEGTSPGASSNPDLVVGDVSMGEPGHRGIWRHRRVPRILARLRGTGLFPLHQGMLAKRHLLESAGGFDTRLRLAADVNQYYDLERLFRPSMRIIGSDVAFMRAGGSANAGLKAVWRGSVEIYRHLLPTHGLVRAITMVLTKSLQSFSEIRYGRPPHERWFEEHLRR
jgi:glycosyltransferase involved in cell wall biosynthesis